MSIIYLIRHGQASFGQENYDKLSDLGIRQSQVVGQRLADQGVVFDAIYTGTLQRQIHTAQAMIDAYEKKGLDLPQSHILPQFNEYESHDVLFTHVPFMVEQDPSLAEHVEQLTTNKRSFQVVFEQAMQRWASGNHEIEGLASWADFTGGVNQGIDTIMKTHGSGKNVAVFTSGGPISVALQRTLHLSNERTMEVSWQVMNASITRLKYNMNNVILYAFNQFGHLEQTGDKTVMTYR